MSDSPKTTLADILVVDDTPANLRLLSQTLAERGYGVRTVTSGARAFESALAAPPHLILLDIRMPEVDGFAVCRQFKTDERTRQIPIIFISALDDLQDKVEAFRAGGVDYITKPFQVEEVLARTETHLALRRLQARLEETNRRLQRELTLAGKVQTGFLPSEMPSIAGWQFAAVLKPARETSGDFYDIIRLPDGKIGLLVADVVDKGVPAALMMAMSSGLLLTHALEYPEAPEKVFDAVNRRLTLHLGGQQFLTTFYAVLEPSSGELVYANGGQPPPLCFGPDTGQPQKLALTGPPLGILEEARWERGTARLVPGSSLVLYTDGVTDAEERSGALYGSERLAQVAQAAHGTPAETILERLLGDVEAFIGGAPQFDDIALVVVSRDR
jgi:sigma-B regulation protein RsbU (phosphoserine phosphatase)